MISRSLHRSPHLAVLMALLVGLLSLGKVAPALAETSGFAGRALSEALQMLEAQGLRLVYTDRWVRPELRVVEEPRGTTPKQLLDALLRPHDLSFREDASGYLMIVPAVEAAETVLLRGRVHGSEADGGLAGARIRLVEADLETISAADGSFTLTAVPIGEQRLEVELEGFLPLVERLQIDDREEVKIDLRLSLMPRTEDQIEVASTGRGPLIAGLSVFSFSRAELDQLPSLAEDALRPLTVLPGTSGNDVSARFHVRGGRADEVMVRLDGHEILEAFHLKDFNNALSILAPEAIERSELLTGGFSAEYGDRMSGVLELTTREHQGPRRMEVALNPLGLEISGAGRWPIGDGTWLGVLRGGTFDLVAEVADDQRDPAFIDAFGKVDQVLTPRQSLRGRVLAATDRLTFSRIETAGDETEVPEIERQELFDTTYENGYLWLSHVGLKRDHYLVSRAAYSRVDRDRRGEEQGEDRQLNLIDRRQLDVGTLAQDGEVRLGAVHDLSWGWEFRRLEADYDYFNIRRIDDPLALIRDQPGVGTTRLLEAFDGSQLGLYVHDHLSLGKNWTVDLGLRFDRNTVLEEEYSSPRFGLAWEGGKRRFRAAWGHFYQSQRLYELQVADGQDRFFESERAEHRILGYEEEIDWATGSPLLVRLELYRHDITNPRPRFENLFDPLSLAPELEADRIQIVPERGESTGLEVSLSGRFGAFDAFASYTYSEITDRIDGRLVRRAIDQPHAFKADLTWRSPWRWLFHVTSEIRSGWPTTSIEARLVPSEGDGEPTVEPVLGPLYGERLPTYFRMDVRVSRGFTLRRGDLAINVDIQNLANHGNVRGFDIDLDIDDGMPSIVRERKFWGGMVPSFNVRWAF